MIELLGTAHVSKESVDRVEEAIESGEYDVVAVELCTSRYRRLKEGTDELDVSSLLKGNIFLSLAVWMLSYVQSRIGADLGVEPGAEMMRAVELAEENDLPLVLIDRDFQITMNRVWGGMGILEKLKMAGSLLWGVSGFGGGEREEKSLQETVEELGEGTGVTEMMEELRNFAPSVAETMVDERDVYMASNLLGLDEEGKRVLAVVGAGHVEGIQRYLDDPASLPETTGLTEVKESRFNLGRMAGIALTVAVVGTLVAILIGQPMEVILQALFYWFLVNGFLSAVGVLAVRGHPVSAVTAFSTAWLTSLTIFLAAGWFAGIAEAYFRKPQPSDMDSLMEAESLGELLSNDLFKVVLVAAAANVGSIVGTLIGGAYLAKVAGLPI